MSDLQFFSNKEFKVRVISRLAEPWFVAMDVADSIGHKDPSTMVRLCREKDVCVKPASDFSSADLAELGNRPITLISESGLYRILAKCNLPKCEPFESWVFDEVLPSIRKNGSYGKIQTVHDMINDPDTAIEILTQIKILRLQNQQLEMERDTAIRTKVHFVEGRDAKVCGQLGGLKKSNNQLREKNTKLTNENDGLRDQIGNSKNWKQVKAISWLKKYFALSKAAYGAIGIKLKQICFEHVEEDCFVEKWKPREIESTEWGHVNSYPTEAIEILRKRLDADKNMLGKYRLLSDME